MQSTQTKRKRFEQLEELRKQGYSKKQAAEFLGLTQPAIAYYYRRQNQSQPNSNSNSDSGQNQNQNQWQIDPGYGFNNRPQDRYRQPLKIVVYSATEFDENSNPVKLAEGTFKECAQQLGVNFTALQKAYNRGGTNKKFIIRRVSK